MGRWMAAAWLVAIAAALPALDVVLAPLAVHDEAGPRAGRPAAPRPDADLLRALAAKQSGGQPFVRRANPAAGGGPRSLLEAARLCEAHAYPYLLYGWLRRTEFSYHAEIKLFDREAGAVVAVFFSSDDDKSYERLVEDVASKIAAWFRKEASIGAAPAPQPVRNVVRLAGALGAWAPLGGDWDRTAVGLGAAAVGARLVPVRPLFAAGALPGYLVFGLDLDYGLAINEAGYEGFLLHMGRLRLSLEAIVEVSGRHSLGFAAGPLLAVDTMAQDRLYDRLTVRTAAAAGAFAALACRYSVSERTALGLAVVADAAGFASPLLAWSPRLFAETQLGRPARRSPP